jgi:hypothetical protein
MDELRRTDLERVSDALDMRRFACERRGLGFFRIISTGSQGHNCLSARVDSGVSRGGSKGVPDSSLQFGRRR